MPYKKDDFNSLLELLQKDIDQASSLLQWGSKILTTALQAKSYAAVGPGKEPEKRVFLNIISARLNWFGMA